MATNRSLVVPAISLVLTLVLGVLPLPDAVEPLRPDWMAVVLIYWSLMAPRKFSLLTAFWMGLALDTLSGALLGQNALALLTVVYLADKFHLRFDSRLYGDDMFLLDPGTAVFPNFHSYIKPKAMHAYDPADPDQLGILIAPNAVGPAPLDPPEMVAFTSAGTNG